LPEELEAYVVELHRLRDRQRARIGRFLHLVEAKDDCLQSKWGAERLGKLNASEKGVNPHDRTAVVVRSALIKMQVARLTGHTQFATFMDLNEAVAWLTAPVN
jgi:hypothetical protein